MNGFGDSGDPGLSSRVRKLLVATSGRVLAKSSLASEHQQLPAIVFATGCGKAAGDNLARKARSNAVASSGDVSLMQVNRIV
jgi:hypothetical protein